MKIDGSATLVVNVKGNKARVLDHFCQDVRLQDYVQWDDMELHDVLLPQGLSDCLVMVFFSYHSYPSGGWESPHSEYSEDLNIETFVVMQNDYKDFEQKQISYIITREGRDIYPRDFEDEDDKNYFDTLIEGWQLLHDEDFVCLTEGIRPTA